MTDAQITPEAVERFDPPRDGNWTPLAMRVDVTGRYVRAYDYDMLAQQNAALKAEVERLTVAHDTVCGALATAIARAEKAEAQAVAIEAQTAVMLNKAASRMDEGFSYNAGNCVRGLISDDAKAALARVVQEAVLAERQACADAAHRALWPLNQQSDWTDYAHTMAGAADSAREAILARAEPNHD
ncbi:hypothetical protein SAMN04244548_01228 [Paracoccus pantotrophus]|nr:hypothetical protein SAMN04244548_01228 [Paracoccus pantotrophus]